MIGHHTLSMPPELRNQPIRRIPARRPRAAGYDDLGVARCPRCNAPLVLRMARRGAVYVCRCPRVRAA